LTVSPDEIRRAFLDVNPQLGADMIQVVCNRNLLRELRVCFSKDLSPRECSQGEQSRRLCNSNSVTMPPVRGGGVGPRGGPTQRGDRM
jgi:ribonuclease T2